MADINEVNGVFGGIGFEGTPGTSVNIEGAGTATNSFSGVTLQNAEEKMAASRNNKELPVKTGFWSNFKAFWLQDIPWNYEIKVELTPYQQKVEDEINEFLHQDVTWEKVHDFLFQEVTITK